MREKDERPEKKSLSEELLAEAFDACMEEQLSFIPPESEISRMHTFSENFKISMERLLRTKGREEKRPISKREFVYGFNKLAAGILLVLVAGGLCAGGVFLVQRDTEKSAAMDTECAPAEAAPVPEDAPIAMEEAAPEEGMEENFSKEELVSEEAEFQGRMIPRAERQVLPESAGNIRTLVNSPIIARDAGSVTLTIGNMEEYAISYDTSMDLEVLIDGIWYQVPSPQEPSSEEELREVTLEPGMAQDEEFLLEAYDLDYEAEQYRIVTYINDTVLCSTFVFEDLRGELEEVWNFTE